MFSHLSSNLKKFSKIHKDWGFNINFRKLKIVIKFSWKDAILAPLHASADHHMCKHQDQLMASVWHPDKYEKISKILSKIFYQVKMSSLKIIPI